MRTTWSFVALVIVVLAATASSLRYTAAASDQDGDGIADRVERGSSYRAAGGRIDHRDLWVECDYMRGQGPAAGVVRQAVRVFRRAPLTNPDGTRGVSLHLTVDDRIPFERTWGDVTQPDGFRVTRSRLLAARSAYMDGDPSYVHYCVFVNQISPSGISGISMDSTGGLGIPGDMFIVALGGPWGPAGRELGIRTGTLIHELGHNLGLRHGGVDHTNYKPNYISVMNYLYQEGFVEPGPAGPRRALHWDYSRFKAKNLNEKSLDERDGIPAAKWFASRFIGYRLCDTAFRSVYFRFNRPIDWNCDGDAFDVGVDYDVNRDFTESVLVSEDNWEHIAWDGGEIGGAGSSAGTEYVDPLTELDAGTANRLDAALRQAAPEPVSPPAPLPLSSGGCNCGCARLATRPCLVGGPTY